MWKWIITAALTVALLAVGWLAWLWRDMEASLQRPLAITDEVYIEVRPGQTIGGLARELADRKLLQHPDYLIFEARRKKLARRMQSGEYRFVAGMNARDLLDQIVSGRVTQYQVTFIEGWTFARLLEELAAHPKILQTLAGLNHQQVMNKLGKPEVHPEGRFFPDTYTFESNAPDTDVLQRAFSRMQHLLAEQWQTRSADLPYESAYDALIMASIIEKETGLAAERGLIAAVFVERLRRGMRLQTDPTVIYGLGDAFDGNLRRADLDNETPYNTYVHHGLPPTPIALPGAGSISAALRPEDGGFLYFVAKGDGSHHFSVSNKEHNRAVARYQRGQNTK